MEVRQVGESDKVTTLELEKSKRILHFSDGTMEEFSDSDGEETVDIADMNVDIDVNGLPTVPRIKYKVYQAGCKFLNGIDYVGEGLANFLGITSPKFVSESDIDAVYEEHIRNKHDDESNSTWKQHNNNNEPNTVITRYPQTHM
ncbi:protein FAM177A1-like [Musca autumnalis]|uniref:protein FAM177A1-like n=1 Tax=Musca autumnalis TaxID=221902 RepID=UPI003CF33D43